ncbi:MAG TPA: SHOCT domain-containing protein [Stellaceae bacterium]|nr:SHOCT domain-containing protein [Stellaceae bacterium]
MDRLLLFVTSSMVSIASVPALAQQAPGTGAQGPYPPYGPMMWGGWGTGWHPGIVIGPVVMVLVLVGTIALIAWLVRWSMFGTFHRHGFHGHGVRCPYCGQGGGRAAIDILEERFARGEIDKTEFEEKRKLLGR